MALLYKAAECNLALHPMPPEHLLRIHALSTETLRAVYEELVSADGAKLVTIKIDPKLEGQGFRDASDMLRNSIESDSHDTCAKVIECLDVPRLAQAEFVGGGTLLELAAHVEQNEDAYCARLGLSLSILRRIVTWLGTATLAANDDDVAEAFFLATILAVASRNQAAQGTLDTLQRQWRKNVDGCVRAPSMPRPAYGGTEEAEELPSPIEDTTVRTEFAGSECLSPDGAFACVRACMHV